MKDLRRFSVEEFWSTIHCCTKGGSDRLMSEADAKYWNRTRLGDLNTHTSVLRGARSWRQQHTIELSHIVRIKLVVAYHRDRGIQLRQILHKVEHERVVVIDHEDVSHESILACSLCRFASRDGYSCPVPESSSRKKPAYTPPQGKGERKVAKLGSPNWLAPVMVACFVIGLAYIVVFYVAGYQIPVMRDLSSLINVGIGFAFIIAGFILATRGK